MSIVIVLPFAASFPRIAKCRSFGWYVLVVHGPSPYTSLHYPCPSTLPHGKVLCCRLGLCYRVAGLHQRIVGRHARRY